MLVEEMNSPRKYKKVVENFHLLKVYSINTRVIIASNIGNTQNN